MDYYINISSADAIKLNDIMFNNYVFKNGEFIPPFEPGTTQYIDVSKSVFFWDDTIDDAISDTNISTDDQNFLTTLKASAKSYDDAVTAGWIVVSDV